MLKDSMGKILEHALLDCIVYVHRGKGRRSVFNEFLGDIAECHRLTFPYHPEIETHVVIFLSTLLSSPVDGSMKMCRLQKLSLLR